MRIRLSTWRACCDYYLLYSTAAYGSSSNLFLRDAMQHCVTSYGSYYSITNVGNGMELDAKNCGTANGTVAHPWQELDNTCQQWNIAP